MTTWDVTRYALLLGIQGFRGREVGMFLVCRCLWYPQPAPDPKLTATLCKKHLLSIHPNDLIAASRASDVGLNSAGRYLGVQSSDSLGLVFEL